MRQSIFITAFLLLTTFALQAQKVSVGLSGAFNQTFWRWEGKDIGKLDWALALTAGLPFRYNTN